MRALGSGMFHDLKDSNGCLHGLLNLVLQDTTLEFEMRGTRSASIYYRGGRLLCIEWDGTQYVLHFDTNYCRHGQNLSGQPSISEGSKRCRTISRQWIGGLHSIRSTSVSFSSLLSVITIVMGRFLMRRTTISSTQSLSMRTHVLTWLPCTAVNRCGTQKPPRAKAGFH